MSPFFANIFQSYRSTCSPSKLFSIRSVKKFQKSTRNTFYDDCLIQDWSVVVERNISRTLICLIRAGTKKFNTFQIRGCLYMYHDGTHQLGRVEYKIIGGSRLLEKGGIRRTLVDLTFGKENLPIHTHLHAKQRLKNYFCFFSKGGSRHPWDP